LETASGEEYAKQKLEKKNFDLIVLNTTQDKGAGFGHDTNKVTIFSKDNKPTVSELKPKKDIAQDIFTHIINRMDA
jgi:phosphopantothenoylcysteine decarboxylase/phosphopantothenate--cysteine ligase